MAEAKKVTAANIKKLWYGETSEITADLTGQALHTLLQGEALKSRISIRIHGRLKRQKQAERTIRTSLPARPIEVKRKWVT